jgi:hypothetical protein
MKRSQFIAAVYGLVGIPETDQNICIGIAWAADEGSRAENNPLDTTEAGPDATDFNTVGVKNYPSWTEGIDETVATLKNGDYDNLIATLKNPDANAMEKINALNSSPWGSHVSPQLYADVVGNRSQFDTEVDDSPEDVPPVSSNPVISHTPEFAKLPVLKIGSEGRAVLSLTTLLAHYGATYHDKLSDKNEVIHVGDKFGPEVNEAVRDYQHAHGIASDGIVGAETWSSFFY